MRMSPQDLYRLRRASLEVQRSALRAQLAHQALQELVLEVQRRYGLLGNEVPTKVGVEAHTGIMQANGSSSLRPAEGSKVAHEPE